MIKFENIKVVANNKQQALEQAPFEIIRDATPAYSRYKKKLGRPATYNDMLTFMILYLEKRTHSTPGKGFYITAECAVTNKRVHPFKIKNNVRHGNKKYQTTYQLIDDATGSVLASTVISKAHAKKLVKQLYKDGYTGNITCLYTKQVVSGKPTAFTAKYSPSVNTKDGTYYLFGIVEKED
jgi:hypothetical protein